MYRTLVHTHWHTHAHSRTYIHTNAKGLKKCHRTNSELCSCSKWKYHPTFLLLPRAAVPDMYSGMVSELIIWILKYGTIPGHYNKLAAIHLLCPHCLLLLPSQIKTMLIYILKKELLRYKSIPINFTLKWNRVKACLSGHNILHLFLHIFYAINLTHS